MTCLAQSMGLGGKKKTGQSLTIMSVLVPKKCITLYKRKLKLLKTARYKTFYCILLNNNLGCFRVGLGRCGKI